jgi:uncharacterized protein (DUF58 family)
VNLLLISSGQQSSGTQTVDVLLKYGKPTGGSFLVEESPVSASLVAETQRLDVPGKLPEVASTGPQMNVSGRTDKGSVWHSFKRGRGEIWRSIGQIARPPKTSVAPECCMDSIRA